MLRSNLLGFPVTNYEHKSVMALQATIPDVRRRDIGIDVSQRDCILT